jgi:hypothetical protein
VAHEKLLLKSFHILSDICVTLMKPMTAAIGTPTLASTQAKEVDMPMMSSTDNKIAGMASQVVFKISGQGGKARSPR